MGFWHLRRSVLLALFAVAFPGCDQEATQADTATGEVAADQGNSPLDLVEVAEELRTADERHVADELHDEAVQELLPGECGDCEDGDPCTEHTCVDGVCQSHYTDNCCSVQGEMVPPGTPSPAYPCRGCEPGVQQPQWPVFPDGTLCGTSPDPQNSGYAVCQAAECCHPKRRICWDGFCACEGTFPYGGCESECDMMRHLPEESESCVYKCGGDCCDRDDQCPVEKPRCAALPRENGYLLAPLGRCVAEAPYPACWVATDCPSSETCVGAPSVETCPHCNSDCPLLAPGTCTANM